MKAAPIEAAPAAHDDGTGRTIREHAPFMQNDDMIVVANLVDEMGRPEDADALVRDEAAHDLKNVRRAP